MSCSLPAKKHMFDHEDNLYIYIYIYIYISNIPMHITILTAFSHH